MSGIIGVLHLDGQAADARALARATDTMAHRGPDRSGVWTAGSVGLGHRLLHTTPESLREALPLEDGPLAITADARIDNRDELVARLGLGGGAEPPTDAALILAAYAAWGEGCVDALVGDFAFAIWDGRTQALFCARDHFGIRPFYYARLPGQVIAFATEVKALLVLGVPARLNEIRVADYLSMMREDPEGTIYEGVLKLPAAHAATLGRDGVRTWRYYTLEPATDLGASSDAEYEEQFRELFEEAVRCRLRSAFPVASQLSGGLDSSAVTCVARDLLRAGGRGPLHTFTLTFDAVPSCDERPYAEAVIAQGGVEPHFVAGDAVGPLSNLTEVYATLDDGLVGGNQHLVWALLRAARGAGTRVVLDGIDGDNVVSHGEVRLRELAAADDWAGFAREVRLLAARYGTADHRQGFQESFATPGAMFRWAGHAELAERATRGPWRRFAAAVRGAERHLGILPRPLIRRYWRRLLVPYPLLRAREARREAARALPLPPLIAPAFAERVGLSARLARFVPLEKRLSLRAVRDTQREVLGSARLTTALESTNHFGAIHGLEVRHPFLDKRLVEFCLALPADQSLRDGWTRYILRRALAHTLPPLVAERVGKGLMTPAFERALLDLDGELLREHLADLGPLAPYVNAARVGELAVAGRNLSEAEQVQAAKVATLSAWLKQRFA